MDTLSSYINLDSHSSSLDFVPLPELSYSPSSSSNTSELDEYSNTSNWDFPSDDWSTFKIKLGASINLAADGLRDEAEKWLSQGATSPSVISRNGCTRRSSYASATNADDSDDMGSEGDEYSPFPSPSSRKRKRSHSSGCFRQAASPGPGSIPSQCQPAKKIRISPPPRNHAAGSPQEIAAILSAIKDPVYIKFKCPKVGCAYRQGNGRVPDFKRHLKTHLRAKINDHTQGYWCSGVRVTDASRYFIPPNAKPYIFRNEDYIGGCMHTFSRQDALKRHLNNPKVPCIAS